MIERARITGVILAGGRGARMGDRDKGLEPFRGEPLVAHARRRLAPQVATVVVSANRNADAYARFGRVVADVDAFAGPLAGLSAALAVASTDFVATVPCDAPLFPGDLVERLAHAIRHAGDSAFACTTEREHPVFALVPHDRRRELDAFLREGDGSMRGWLATIDARPVLFDDETAFGNLNTIDELRRAEARG